MLKINSDLKVLNQSTGHKRARDYFTSSDDDESDSDFGDRRRSSLKRRKLDTVHHRHNHARCCEEAISDKTRKSGLQLGAEINVHRRIQWPHQYVLRNSLPVKFDSLTIAELVSGLLSMCDHAKSKRRRTEARSIKMLAHAVLEDAKNLEWSIVRRSVQAVLLKLERGTLDWAQTKEIKDLRQWELVMPVRRITPGTTSSRQSTSLATPCPAFQAGTCTINSTEHMSDRGPVKHICQFCLNSVFKEFPHSEKSCRRRKVRTPSRDGQRTSDQKPSLK